MKSFSTSTTATTSIRINIDPSAAAAVAAMMNSEKDSSDYEKVFEVLDNALNSKKAAVDFEQVLRSRPSHVNYSCDSYWKPYYRGQPSAINPNIYEGITHLKLLRCFAEMKGKVCHGLTSEKDIEIVWKAFVTNAVRRFIIFITILKKTFPENFNSPVCDMYEISSFVEQRSKNSKLESFITTVLPPLDVLMVWHSFMLNPKSAFDDFARNEFLSFLFIPFPLKMIDDAISNTDFTFHPQIAHIQKFNDLCYKAGTVIGYNAYEQPFIPEQIEVDIRCPICNFPLTKAKLSDIKTNRGFADGEFSARKSKDSKCMCGFDEKITHDDLRKRQLVSDIWSTRIFPSIYRYKSRHMAKDTKKRFNQVQHINDWLKPIVGYTKLAVTDPKNSLNHIVDQFRQVHCRAIPTRLVFREYLTMNPIHLTYSLANTFVPTEDLVGCVLRQERFIKKMNDINWLESPWIKASMENGLKRYNNFFHLFARSFDMLVPTLDIDLFWHTHQLSFYYYFKSCQAIGRSFIDHNDKVDQTHLDNSFEKTAKLYRSKYKEDYTFCTCWYCMAVKDRSASLFKKVLRRNSSTGGYDLVYDGTVGESHVSIHNAIAYGSRAATIGEGKLDAKYKLNKNKSALPMYDPVLSGTTTCYPNVYVIPPLAPVPACNNPSYPDSYCTTRPFTGQCGGGSSSGTSSSYICGGGCGSNGNCTGASGGCGSSSGGGGGCGGGGGGGGCGGGGCGGGS